ncbi:hypothetical protein SARC_02067 [Sphaeroforma arctica JP610]|uniref:ABC transporter domain-containing protein n=1 Tax=Sphaeroforma arctica JP610 TaxID=667725 RepID=A0A0L0GBY3_9EUKA|nr:hypothetical protein SARC_02067 [Sphaeroforma arctica JP610]KNC85763.1 hypothetical protein SARC_02067 [Sphaeroforma arctica JP610]|eukprot:XP_014159665.1 hypothetical protein SARC_02067 [Sphaeroforma arctica JP610]
MTIATIEIKGTNGEDVYVDMTEEIGVPQSTEREGHESSASVYASSNSQERQRKNSSHSINALTHGPSEGWNGTPHLAVELYRTLMRSREQDYVYEDDKDTADILPFIKEFLEVTGRDIRKSAGDLGMFPLMELKFKELGFRVTAREYDQTILHPISGAFAPGSLVAIMGPSGCGKSTLLDILSQKKTLPYTGEITVNGHSPDKYFNRMTSYVPQADYGSGLDKVSESAMFASKMKAYYKADQANAALRQQHLDFLLKVLGLSHIANSFIGDGQTRGISGGQRRRLTLLKGLITGPGIAFLDEPTSGLSSTDSETCVRALKNLAKLTGTTFIVVIHQPKSTVFEMFDHLLLLSQGKAVYNGLRSEAQDYFTKLGYPVQQYTTPADHFLDIITPGQVGANPEFFIEQYAKYINPTILNNLDVVAKGDTLKQSLVKIGHGRERSKFPLSRWHQYCLLQKREFRLFFRNADEILTILANNLVMGLLLGLVYQDVYSAKLDAVNSARFSYQFAYIFFVLIVASLTALNSVPAMLTSRVIFQNERAEGYYDVLPYMISKFLTTFVTCAITGTLVLVMSSYWLAGFPASQVMFVFAIVLVEYICVESIVSFTSSCATSIAMANSLAGAVISILSLFNGWSANSLSTPTYVVWIQYLSPFYYGFQAIVVHLYDETVTKQYALHSDWGVWGGIVIMLAMTIFYRYLQFWALKYCNQLER